MITPSLDYLVPKIRIKFNGSCLKQDKITYTHGKITNIYIVYEISKSYNISSYPTLENCLFGAVSLTKNADIDQYKCSGYGIGFDRLGEFSFGSRGFGRNVIIFGADMSNSVNKKFILSLHFNGDNSFLFVNGNEIHKFKAKDSEIVATPLCLGNISRGFSVDNMKKTGLNGYVYDFGVDYGAITVNDKLDIHKYLMEKNNMI